MNYFVTYRIPFNDFDEYGEELIKYEFGLDYFDSMSDIHEFIDKHQKYSHYRIYKLVEIIN